MPTEQTPSIGAINPYALAELRLGKKIDWQKEANPRQLLEQAFKLPYDKIFDPQTNPSLFVGIRGIPTAAGPAHAQPLTALKPINIMDEIAVGGTGVVWQDPGHFFEESATVFDPVQGALGDCYFIAALSSVAWARPYLIAQRTRASDAGMGALDMIEFFKSGKPEKVEVTEKLPLHSPGNTYIYARSRDVNEIWPAVYEKAYAKWRTGSGDQPDYNPIAGGDPVGALSQITGLTPSYFWNSGMTGDAIWQKVRENSLSYKTFNPMVAWTYNSAADAPNHSINYNNAHIVACHAYSILGWHFENNQKFVVLRNPWGTHEATLNVSGANWTSYDNSFWRTINLPAVDGVFALRVDTFKDYFSGFGVAK